MTGRPKSEGRPPMLPLRRPWWLLVLLAMLGFGLLQEQSKIKVNHYLKVGDEAQFWQDDAGSRLAWWTVHAPVGRHNFYVSRSTWSFFHGLDRGELVAFKWGLSAVILVVFFMLDVLFLRTAGVPDRVPWLLLIYVTSGVPMVGLAMSGMAVVRAGPRHAGLPSVAAALLDGGGHSLDAAVLGPSLCFLMPLDVS